MAEQQSFMKRITKELTDIFRGLQWKLVIIFTLLIIMSMEIIGVYFYQKTEDTYIQNNWDNIKKQATLLDTVVPAILTQKDSVKRKANLDRTLKNFVFLQTKDGTQTVASVDILSENQTVLSSTDPGKSSTVNTKIVNVTSIPSGSTNTIQEDSAGNSWLVYSYRIYSDNNQTLGYIYITQNLRQTFTLIHDSIKLLIKSALVALIFTCILIYILARTITSPLKEITSQATSMAAGDFDRQVKVKSEDEIGRLGTAFNHLASHLRTALKQNEEEKEKLETVLSNMSDGVLATNYRGLILFKNDRAEKILSKEVALGDSIFSLLSMPEPLSFPLEKERHFLLELESDDPKQPSIIKVSFTPISHSQEESVGVIAVLNDVTEQEKLDRQRKDFVANVSHELRTPLTTIRSYLEALDDGAINEPELATRFLHVTRQEAERMTRLIQDLLQLTRLDAKQSHFDKQVMHLSEMLEDVADRFSVQCKQKEITLETNISILIPKVYADRDKLDQVLDNLISNAVKYTPAGGSITVAARKRNDGHALVSVSDTGVGIPQKDIQHIFERFYRVDKARARNFGGTGLGLSIAQEIIQAHNGEIWIESEINQGTTVYFSLPPVGPEV